LGGGVIGGGVESRRDVPPWHTRRVQLEELGDELKQPRPANLVAAAAAATTAAATATTDAAAATATAAGAAVRGKRLGRCKGRSDHSQAHARILVLLRVRLSRALGVVPAALAVRESRVLTLTQASSPSSPAVLTLAVAAAAPAPAAAAAAHRRADVYFILAESLAAARAPAPTSLTLAAVTPGGSKEMRAPVEPLVLLPRSATPLLLRLLRVLGI